MQTDTYIPGILSPDTLEKIRALYIEDLEQGETRAIKYRAADKLLSLARFELAQARAAAKAIAQAEKESQPPGPTVEEATQVLATTRVISENAPFVLQHPRDYRHIPGIGALTPINHKRLQEAGLLSKDGRRPHPSLLQAWQQTSELV